MIHIAIIETNIIMVKSSIMVFYIVLKKSTM